MTRNERTRAARLWLCARYPDVFLPKGKPKRPLKIGIREDVHAAARAMEPDERPSLNQIRRAINDYCGGPSYLVACQCGAVRIDMHGRAAGKVRPDDERFAFSILRGIVATMETQRKSQVQEVLIGVLTGAVEAHDARMGKVAA